MRKILIALALCSTASLAACQSQLDDKPKAEVKDAKPKGDAPDEKALAHASKVVPLDKASSSVGFVGAKVTADHEGVFEQIDGKLTLSDAGAPTKLEITVNVGSLKIEPADLQGHLLSADFFDAPKFPESKFTSSEIRSKAGEGGATHEIEGELTLHGVTKVVTFPAKIETSPTLAKGSTEFKINRKEWNIVYPGMAEDLIKDDVLLKLSLSFPIAG